MKLLVDSNKRIAIPSWSGYQYQGQIAIITMLIQLVKLKGKISQIENYEIAVEDIEDFSIYNEGKLESIHQVKAEKKNTVAAYGEALYYMASELEKRGTTDVVAYLHTSEEIRCTDWKSEVIRVVDKFVPEKQQELELLLKDSDKMCAKVEELKARITKTTGKISRNKGAVWNAICDAANIEKAEDITEQNLKEAIENYLKEFKKIDIQSLMDADRIRLFQYSDDCTNIRIDETEKVIEEWIGKYWGEELKEKRRGSNEVYRRYIQELVEENVTARHVNNKTEKKISFDVFAKKLNEAISITEEQRILENKDMFFRWKKEFCNDRCNERMQCENCDLERKKDWFLSMELEELKNAFYMMSPHVSDDISRGNAWLIMKNGVKYSTFRTLKALEMAEEDSAGRMIYEKEKNYLLTDIAVDSESEHDIHGKLKYNEVLDKICEKLSQNRDFALQRMEVDSLIVYNCSGESEIEDIEDLSRNTGRLSGMRDRIEDEKEREPSYMKITNKKQISLIDARKFIKECGGEINEA